MLVPLRHVPILFVASGLTFGGMWANVNPHGAALLFGLPPRIAESLPAQAVMTLCSGRSSVIGMAIWTFYLKKDYAAVDTILILIGYLGLVDGYICWREGVPAKAVERAVASIFAAAVGWFGWTADAAATLKI